MTNRIKNDPWEPWDQNAHARDLEQTDVFNRLTDDAIPVRGGLRTKLEELANTDHPEVAQVLADAGIKNPRIPRRFYLSDGKEGTVFADDAGFHAQIVIDGQTLTFTADNKDDAMAAAERHANSLRGPRELTESELLRVARLAQSGQSAAACDLYVRLRLDGEAQRSDEEILTDPKLTSLLNTAAITIWRYTRPDYVLDQEFEGIVAQAAEIRPLTVNNVDFLFDRFQEERSERGRATRRSTQVAPPENELVPSQAEVQNELENLSDVELEKLRLKTMHHRGDLVRKFNADVLGR